MTGPHTVEGSDEIKEVYRFVEIKDKQVQEPGNRANEQMRKLVDTGCKKQAKRIKIRFPRLNNEI